MVGLRLQRRSAPVLQCRERGALSGIRVTSCRPSGETSLQCRERGALSGISEVLSIRLTPGHLQCRERGALSGIYDILAVTAAQVEPSM